MTYSPFFPYTYKCCHMMRQREYKITVGTKPFDNTLICLDSGLDTHAQNAMWHDRSLGHRWISVCHENVSAQSISIIQCPCLRHRMPSTWRIDFRIETQSQWSSILLRSKRTNALLSIFYAFTVIIAISQSQNHRHYHYHNSYNTATTTMNIFVCEFPITSLLCCCVKQKHTHTNEASILLI